LRIVVSDSPSSRLPFYFSMLFKGPTGQEVVKNLFNVLFNSYVLSPNMTFEEFSSLVRTNNVLANILSGFLGIYGHDLHPMYNVRKPTSQEILQISLILS